MLTATPKHAQRSIETQRFLKHCRRVGAGGIQAPLASLDEPCAVPVRETAEECGMYLEVSARLPKDEASLNQSEKTVRASRAAGVSVIGTVILVGHRYEMSQSLESWKEFTRTSWKSLTVAEPILAKQEMRLAIENHTDWRFDQMLRILEHVDSDAVGVKIDAGNNMSLLEGSL